MNNLNQVLLEGHLCQKPQLKQPIAGTFVCTFTIGVNRTLMTKDGKSSFAEETSFFPVNVWGDLGILCEKYLTQGRGVRVVGRLKQERWGLETDNPRQRVVVVAEHVEFMPERKKAEEKTNDQEEKAVIDANLNAKTADSADIDVAASCPPNETSEEGPKEEPQEEKPAEETQQENSENNQ